MLALLMYFYDYWETKFDSRQSLNFIYRYVCMYGLCRVTHRIARKRCESYILYLTFFGKIHSWGVIQGFRFTESKSALFPKIWHFLRFFSLTNYSQTSITQTSITRIFGDSMYIKLIQMYICNLNLFAQRLYNEFISTHSSSIIL